MDANGTPNAGPPDCWRIRSIIDLIETDAEMTGLIKISSKHFLNWIWRGRNYSFIMNSNLASFLQSDFVCFNHYSDSRKYLSAIFRDLKVLASGRSRRVHCLRACFRPGLWYGGRFSSMMKPCNEMKVLRLGLRGSQPNLQCLHLRLIWWSHSSHWRWLLVFLISVVQIVPFAKSLPFQAIFHHHKFIYSIQ